MNKLTVEQAVVLSGFTGLHMDRSANFMRIWKNEWGVRYLVTNWVVKSLLQKSKNFTVMIS